MRLTGTIAMGAEPELLRLGIDDPAHYAAWRLRAMLEARGVRVTGAVAARHRPPGPADDPGRAMPRRPARARQEALARLAAPPLGEDLVRINKVSQNLHAELMLRRLGRQSGTGSIADGAAVVRGDDGAGRRARAPTTTSPTARACRPTTASLRAGVVRLLRWAAAQPWGAAWRATFPIAGVDGTLARRFRGTPLESRLFAKTGTLNATNALSGYMIARSGRTLIFSMSTRTTFPRAPARPRPWTPPWS